MRHCILVLCLAATAASVACAQSPAPARPAEAPPIFREISLGAYGTVTLGVPFTPRGTRSAQVAPDLHALVTPPEWSFGGTDSLLVRTRADGRVVALHFVYPTRMDYAAMVAEYEGMLGRPTVRSAADSAGGRVEHTVWQDARTRFELSRFSRAGQPSRIRSAMLDRSPEP